MVANVSGLKLSLGEEKYMPGVDSLIQLV